MASNRRALAICDTCGFRYPHRVMKLNSYGMLICPTDYEGAFDLKNHPQNRVPNVRDNPAIRNPRPESNNDRNIAWQNASSLWEDTDSYWNTI
jgi:hypothetical protein